MRKSTLRRIRASQANGAKSRGPITPEGRASSAQNALTHQLTAKTVVLSNESQEKFTQLSQSYFDLLQPQNQLEIDLVNDIVVSKWRHMRTWSMECAIQDDEMRQQKKKLEKEYTKIDEPTRGAKTGRTLNDKSTFVANLSLYETRHRRAYTRALQLLTDLRGGALFPDTEPGADPDRAPEQSTSEPLTNPQNSRNKNE